MSFLLDALRKSERASRQRAAPTIHSMEPGGYEPSERPEWLPLALLGGVAFVLMTWLGLQQFEVFQGGPGAAERARQPVASQPPAAETHTGQPPVAATVANTHQPSASASSPRSDSSVTVTQPSNRDSSQATAGEPRTPVELLEAPATSGNTAAASNPPNSVATTSSETAAPGVRQSAPAPQVEALPRQNHIDYWDLPSNVRGQLPEFKIRVLVYAEQPDNRFLLINGLRLKEGEDLQTGLRVEEIRRDGVIFSYQRYRFLVSG